MAGRCEECGVEEEYVHLWNRGPNAGSSLCLFCAQKREETFWLIRAAFKERRLCEKCGEVHDPFQIDCDREDFLRRKKIMQEYFEEKAADDKDDA